MHCFVSLFFVEIQDKYTINASTKIVSTRTLALLKNHLCSTKKSFCAPFDENVTNAVICSEQKLSNSYKCIYYFSLLLPTVLSTVLSYVYKYGSFPPGSRRIFTARALSPRRGGHTVRVWRRGRTGGLTVDARHNVTGNAPAADSKMTLLPYIYIGESTSSHWENDDWLRMRFSLCWDWGLFPLLEDIRIRDDAIFESHKAVSF